MFSFCGESRSLWERDFACHTLWHCFPTSSALPSWKDDANVSTSRKGSKFLLPFLQKIFYFGFFAPTMDRFPPILHKFTAHTDLWESGAFGTLKVASPMRPERTGCRRFIPSSKKLGLLIIYIGVRSPLRPSGRPAAEASLRNGSPTRSNPKLLSDHENHTL